MEVVMAYLLIIFWMGGASVTVIDSHHHPYSKGDTEARNFARCLQSAQSIRKHFKKDDIFYIKCIPQIINK